VRLPGMGGFSDFSTLSGIKADKMDVKAADYHSHSS
jgi:hypothetical protein